MTDFFPWAPRPSWAGGEKKYLLRNPRYQLGATAPHFTTTRVIKQFRDEMARITRSRAVSPRRPNSLYFSRPNQLPAAPPGGPSLEGPRVGEGSRFGRPVPLEPVPLLPSLGGEERGGGEVGGCRGDALAEMPLVKPRAQLAFKNSMIRGILQFTLRIAFRCVLHRCKSQDIRC